VDAMEYVAQERRTEFMRQAAHERLVRQALAGRHPRLRPILRTIGGALVRLGQRLQAAAEGPQLVSPIPTVRHHA
jgi:hypothetical protein